MSLEDDSITDIYFEKKLKSSLDEFGTINGINEVISVLIDLKKNEFYKRLIYRLGVDINPLVTSLDIGMSISKLNDRINFLELGKETLEESLFVKRSKDIITFRNLYLIYNFLEAVYFMNLGHKLTYIDIKRLYDTELDKKLVFLLYNFDRSSELPAITKEFFIKLKNLNWENKEVEGFYNALNQKRKEFLYQDRIDNFREIPTFPLPDVKTGVFRMALYLLTMGRFHPREDFIESENAFLLFLAGCSAVNDNRDKINFHDVIVAYKTYYKLLSTDISVIVDDLGDKNDSNGYLVCDKCGSYYELQDGESPDDFSDECECGGKLIYSDSETV